MDERLNQILVAMAYAVLENYRGDGWWKNYAKTDPEKELKSVHALPVGAKLYWYNDDGATVEEEVVVGTREDGASLIIKAFQTASLENYHTTPEAAVEDDKDTVISDFKYYKNGIENSTKSFKLLNTEADDGPTTE